MNNPSKDKKHILFVEDNELIQEVYKGMLKNEAYELSFASSSKEALKLLENKYDLIFLDIGLPETSGIELAKIIRKNGINKKTKIYALTAFSERIVKEDCLKAGMNRVLSKPIGFDELIAVINEEVLA